VANLLCKADYEEQTAATRDARMKWWREARFGMFVHFGLYSQMGRHEWAQTWEGMPVAEYEKLADKFNPGPGAPREWCALAKEAGMKYVVFTTRHHEGFSLWDSKVNPYNSVNYGPKRDIVREFVNACREFDLKIGFYSSLMDWHHPDSWACAHDIDARKRFLDYIEALNVELLSNYGKIDILWYDLPNPMQHWEGWDSVARNQRLRSLQPDILINNRSRLDEDFGTPEERIQATERDWEACMTFNGISWGYLDPDQVKDFAYRPGQIIKMLHECTSNGGNLLLNIGPAPDGSVPPDEQAALKQVGAWLKENGEAVYGKITHGVAHASRFLNGVTASTVKENTMYFWNIVWPKDGTIGFGGFPDPPKKVTLLKDGTEIEWEHKGHRIIFKNLPEKKPDEICGVTVFKVEFDKPIDYKRHSYYPQMTKGKDIAGENKV